LWNDCSWTGIQLQDYIIYELHVGTFTREGTFLSIIPHLDSLKALGITAIELMPVSQFPGNRNWGYDGVYPFAVHNSYGGPEELKRLVDACHQKGLAVILDVVYNHLGPEGNYFADFGPYFTDRYETPWGLAVNFDGPYSDGVRRFFIENALYWIREFHMDALRIDAVHAIMDFSAQPFLKELTLAVHKLASQLNRYVYLIAESALNDTRIVRSPKAGGYGLDAQWNDDFHHALHTLLTKDKKGYYIDFGEFQHFIKAFCQGFVYSGQVSAYRRRRHGNSSKHIPAHRFVVFAQNHDQVGNRMRGERLSVLVSFEGLKLAAGAVLLAPYIPLLFMGEEYGETAPFLYFVSHSDPALIEAVRQGRRDEFSAFGWSGDPPDPQDERTFFRARLNHRLPNQGKHRVLRAFYKELIHLRKRTPALACLTKEQMRITAYEREKVVIVRRWHGASEAITVLCFGQTETSVPVPFPVGQWEKQLDSVDRRWQGPGTSVPPRFAADGEVTLTFPPHAFVVFTLNEET
jgi:maltooligosyltrehalose trehalohydrolase